MKQKRKHIRWDWAKIIWWFIFLTMAASVVFSSIEMALAPSVPDPSRPYKRVKGDYVLMLLQCIVGVLAMLMPSFLRRRLRVIIPSKMMVLFALFLYCAIYLGEVRGRDLNKTDRVPMNLSPVFVAFFALCFAVFLGVVWEFYEFTADGILHTNMQKFALESGESLVGRAALMDTMKDLLVDTLGALVMAVIGYISIKYQKGWVEKFQLHREKRVKKQENRQ